MKKLLLTTIALLVASLVLFAAGCASNPPDDPALDETDEETAQQAEPDYKAQDRSSERRPSSPRGLGFPGGDPTLSPIPFP